MMYVFDTSSLIQLETFYPSNFPSFWQKFDRLIEDGDVLSVKEVFRELEEGRNSTELDAWLKQHNKTLFKKPSQEETLFVRQILETKNFSDVIRKVQLLKGKPVADPFVVAAAKIHLGTVVTEERERPNGAKIPTICKHFKIPCINLKLFLQEMNWIF